MISKLSQCCALIILVCISFIACRRSEFTRMLPPDANEVRGWLSKNGGIAKSEKYTLVTVTGTPVVGSLDWNATVKYNWQGNGYIEIPFSFEGNKEVTGTGVASLVDVALVLRRKSDGYEGAVRTTLNGSLQASLTGGPDEIATLQTYQLLDGSPGNIWYSTEGLSNPVAVTRRSLSPQQILSMRANADQMRGTVSRSVTDEVCETKTSTSYQTICWYATPQQEANQHATCQSQPYTVAYRQCRDTTIIGTPNPPGGGSPGGPPSGPPSYPPGGQGGTTTLPTEPDCAQAAINNAIAKELLDNGSYMGSAPNNDVTLSVNAFHYQAQQPFTTYERSMSLAYRAQFDLNLARPFITVSTTKVNTGTANVVVTDTKYANDSVIIVAGIHQHPVGQFPAPSARDVYALYKGNNGNPGYRYQFVFANDGSKYLISITTPTTFNSFTSGYSESTSVDLNNGWNPNSKIGKEFAVAEAYFRDKMGMGKFEAYENAHAYILNAYTGTTLSKYNPSTGKFESIRPRWVIKPKLDPVTNLQVRDTTMDIRKGCN